MELDVRRSTVATTLPLTNACEEKGAATMHDQALTIDRKLGVLVVGNFLSDSVGTRGVCEELALRLRALNWLNVLTSSSKTQRVSRLLDMLATIRRRRHEFDVAQVDVFSGRSFFWAEAVCAALKWARKPYILTLHGGNLPPFARRHPHRVRRLLQSADAVTAPSRYLQEQMAAYRTDLRLLPNALDLGAYTFRVRKNVRPALVWLRAFHEVYNPTLAPRVLKLLAADFPEVQLTMMGPDKGDGSLERTRQLAAELGVLDRLRLPGRVSKPDVPEWLARGDIFLNTSTIDNTPVSVLEAMACGLCVVSTKVGGLSYLVEHEQEALLVPSDDPAAMAAAVRRVLTEPGFGELLSVMGRQKLESCDWSVVLPQWEVLLRSVADGGHLWPPAATKRLPAKDLLLR